MSAKETNKEAVQTTTHYWGYREIDPSEFKYVGGGDDGDGGDGGDGGTDASAADAAAAAAQADSDPSTNGSVSDVTGEEVAGAFCTFAGVVVGLATAVATTSPALGAYAGFTTSWACEAQSGNLASNAVGGDSSS
jgi:hypothetical protein